jgi:hypothetical protein
MSESTTTVEATPAEKRAALQTAGYAVGARGKLSAEAEAKYAELKAAGQA